MEDLLTATEVAEHLSLSRERWYQLLNQGRAPEPLTVKGGVQLWTRPQIDAWNATRVLGRPGRPRKDTRPT